ncbi:MAG: hypothetical protein ACXWG7_00220 [Chthoniobacterales bacterium]
MPVAPYSVFQLHLESSDRVEELGSKPKFWVRLPDYSWLFKFGRPGTGEDWAEKIGAEVGELLGVPHARVELATFGEKHGSVSRSFVQAGVDLIHGNEILAGHVLGYDADKRFGQYDHTFPRIVTAFYDVFPEGTGRIEALTTLAGYLTLDAIIGNVDRHHENWGVLRFPPTAGQTGIKHTIAPTFDHASSLGRELRDEKRLAFLENRRVGDYVYRGSGGIYWKETDPKGENPLRLCLRAATVHRSYFQPWLDRVKQIKKEELELLVTRVPPDWMSEIAKRFAVAMMSFTTEELKKL